jgi:hypothetical protein
MFYNNKKLLQGVGIEPTRIAPLDLKTNSLTTRTSLHTKNYIRSLNNPFLRNFMKKTFHPLFFYFFLNFSESPGPKRYFNLPSLTLPYPLLA